MLVQLYNPPCVYTSSTCSVLIPMPGRQQQIQKDPEKGNKSDRDLHMG